MPSAEIRKLAYPRYDAGVEPLGLRRRRRGHHTYDLKNGAFGTLELLSFGNVVGIVDFVPIIGIWHPELARAMEDLGFEPRPHRPWEPQLMTGLSHVCRDEVLLKGYAEHPEDCEPIVDRIVEHVGTTAIPWWESNAELTELAKTVRAIPEFHHPRDLPLIYFVLGDRESAESAMDRFEQYETIFPYGEIRARLAQAEGA